MFTSRFHYTDKLLGLYPDTWNLSCLLLTYKLYCGTAFV